MRLSDTSVRNARPRPSPYKLADGHGLVLLINPNGSKWWRLRYSFGGREKMLSLGTYPDVSLKLARERHAGARQLLALGQDPGVQRLKDDAAQGITFEFVAREWLAVQKQTLAPVTYSKARWMLESFVFPRLGGQPITQITAPELLLALRRIEEAGHRETARRTKQRCSQIFRYAIATGRADRDVAADLRGALAPPVTRSHAAVTDPERVGALLRAIDGYEGHEVTAHALRLAPLVFVRPGELRAAEWAEIDLEHAEWRIAAHRMKMREAHLVPLSRQALEILRSMHFLTGNGRYVFPSLRTFERPMSENTINAALRRLGYTNEEMTGHGFRALASTRLNEMGWAPDLIELQLAHAERDKVRAVYNRAARLADRRAMMQAWASYLESLKAGGKIIPLKLTG